MHGPSDLKTCQSQPVLPPSKLTERMDTVPNLEFACTATRSLSKIARTLAESDKKSIEAPKLIDLATRLYNIAEELDQPLPRQKSIPANRVARYLADLEKICNVSVASTS